MVIQEGEMAKRAIPITLDPNTIQKLDKWAEREKRPRTSLLRLIVLEALEKMEQGQKLEIEVA